MKNFPLITTLTTKPQKKWSFHKDRLAKALSTPKGYTCGMCGNSFRHKKNAWTCVIQDLAKHETFPAHVMNEHECCLIQCLLCGKTYANAQDTALCLAHDLKRDSVLPPEIVEHLNVMILNELKGFKKTRENALPSRHSILRTQHAEAKLNQPEIKKTKNPSQTSTKTQSHPPTSQAKQVVPSSPSQNNSTEKFDPNDLEFSADIMRTPKLS